MFCQQLHAYIAALENPKRSLVPVLHKAKEFHGKIDLPILKQIAEELGMTLAAVAGTASFYSEFNPQIPSESGPVAPNIRFATEEKPHYEAVSRWLEKADQIIPQLEQSQLRGRSGSFFPVAAKWNLVKNTPAEEKYIVCNGSEGEPDTYKDYALLMLRPESIIEGMVLCSAAVGAKKGYLYVRADYKDAQKTLAAAIEKAYQDNFLGKNICGSSHSFDLELRSGGGAYVCGEETGLLEYLEGNRGEPRLKPPYPGTAGLWNSPTVINNVETFACISGALNRQEEAKLVTLAGHVKKPGVYEIPFGLTIKEVYEKYGGGSPDGTAPKGFQIGGGASGTICSMDKQAVSLTVTNCLANSIPMGTGSLRFFAPGESIPCYVRECVQFFTKQSCGRCAPCSLGNEELLRLLDQLINGNSSPELFLQLREMCEYIRSNARCALGQTAPAALRSAMDSFADEFSAARKEVSP